MATKPKPLIPYAAMSEKRGPAPRPPWRTGANRPSDVYEGQRLVCQCNSVMDSSLIVAAVNHILDLARDVIKTKGEG